MIDNHLAGLRVQRGLSAAQIAEQVGVSRQTIHALESGSYVPNTVVALRLARVLGVSVEQVFSLPSDANAPALPAQDVDLLPGSETPEPGQPLQLCRVDRRTMATLPSPLPWYLPASDAVAAGAAKLKGKARAQLFQQDETPSKRLLVAGCDPGVSVLARHLQRSGVELVLAHRNSSQALALLKAGCVHVAGTHLRDNLPSISRMFAKGSVAVISLAIWEEGIVTGRGNPKGVKRIEDFARRDVAIVNREAGAGTRLLLDQKLRQLGIPAKKVRGYERTAAGHLAAAWQVHSGLADCCLATRAAARVFGLGFVSLVSERYDVVLRKRHLDLPAMQTLLETLARSAFRRELESLGGYDTTPAGTRLI